MSSSKRWTSSSGTELPGRLSPLHASALSPVRQSARRSVSRSEPVTTTSPVAVSIARTLWPSSSTGNKSGKSKAPPAPPSPLSSAPPPPPSTSVASLADHFVRDDAPRALSRQRSCTELPRFADADTEARKIGKLSGAKGGVGHVFGRSMHFLPSTRPAGVTLTPVRIAPSDLHRLANTASLDAAADVASSGSECSDASRGSATTTPRTPSTKPHSPLLPRTGSVRLLGSSNTQWALSPTASVQPSDASHQVHHAVVRRALGPSTSSSTKPTATSPSPPTPTSAMPTAGRLGLSACLTRRAAAPEGHARQLHQRHGPCVVPVRRRWEWR
ncbi:uncharacterized protein [Miscanthus floridulus]|uniref:uncharacterized protein n=1 Tax=Miscanthus floridulus TaxID=154761 RepID=UPI00345ACCB3